VRHGLARTGREAASLARATRTATRAHRASPLAVVRRARRLRARGFEYDEALRLGLLDPGVPDAVCDGHVSRHANMDAQRRLNGADMPPLAAEKLLFDARCRALGLPVPPLLGVVDRNGAGWSHTGRPIGDAAGFAAFLAEDVPEEVIVKPSAGYEGRGVRLVRTAGADAAALRAELLGHPQFATWLVQERLRNHPALARLGGTETLHCARIVTLVDRRGAVHELWASVKLGLAGGAADNFHGGAAGNGICLVGLEDGRAGPFVAARPDGCGFTRSPVAPDGRPVEGAVLPDWEAARALVRRAAPAFLPLATLGWDVALTPAGPVLVECNTRWGAAPDPSMRAHVDRLEAEAAG
jgi:hypothetical protein